MRPSSGHHLSLKRTRIKINNNEILIFIGYGYVVQRGWCRNWLVPPHSRSALCPRSLTEVDRINTTGINIGMSRKWFRAKRPLVLLYAAFQASATIVQKTKRCRKCCVSSKSYSRVQDKFWPTLQIRRLKKKPCYLWQWRVLVKVRFIGWICL